MRKLDRKQRFVLLVSYRMGQHWRKLSITRSGGFMKFDLDDHGIQFYANENAAMSARRRYETLLNETFTKTPHKVEVIDVLSFEPERYAVGSVE